MAVKNANKKKEVDTELITENNGFAINRIESSSKELKKYSFFYGMISAEFWGFRQVEFDTAALSLAEKIKSETGRDDGLFMLYYAQRIYYTQTMSFNWNEDAPSECTNLEVWWKMVADGNEPSECYLYYTKFVANYITNLFQEAMEESHKIWKPIEQTMLDERTTDPK